MSNFHSCMSATPSLYNFCHRGLGHVFNELFSIVPVVPRENLELTCDSDFIDSCQNSIMKITCGSLKQLQAEMKLVEFAPSEPFPEKLVSIYSRDDKSGLLISTFEELASILDSSEDGYDYVQTVALGLPAGGGERRSMLWVDFFGQHRKELLQHSDSEKSTNICHDGKDLIRFGKFTYLGMAEIDRMW